MATKSFHQLLGPFLTVLVLQSFVVKCRPVKSESPGQGSHGGQPTSDDSSSIPAYLDPQAVATAIDTAFRKWQAAVPKFAFGKIYPGEYANIKIGFTPLDGYYGYGYYPPDGRLYLDNSHTNWSTKSYPAGYEEDLMSGAMNAIGHTLGLEDSTNPSAVMYPTLYSGSISEEDMNRIQNLYYYTPHLELGEPM
ncbi:metalloendoproteinase 1-MMP-like [Hibiscus syriacus]|uniref:metalloendoproteinase 1-MMP-like n=1 Tax=Hibiscus syriacus TaxID=106335 RepID=UPI0019221CE5|nr:metalloendoproteinase 1-MMP-like [Hibiscus syriacus]